MKRILIVDDDPAMLELLKHYLRNEPIEISCASDGEEGLRIYNAQKVDLVILDIFMPNMDGIQTIMKIRQTSPDCKIIVISGGGQATGLEYLKHAKALGADEALNKPLNRENFLKTVNKMFSNNC